MNHRFITTLHTRCDELGRRIDDADADSDDSGVGVVGVTRADINELMEHVFYTLHCRRKPR